VQSHAFILAHANIPATAAFVTVAVMQPDSLPEISATDAAASIEAGALLLDVREDDEWAAGHAPQAVHIPMSSLTGRTAEIPTDRTVICVCHVGGRSAVVTDALNRAGWQAVNLTGGMNAWEAAGLPVVT
jgi:rhodanese-related sulfurtransferase